MAKLTDSSLLTASSQWVITVPITDHSAESAAKSFTARWVAAFGFSQIVTTDSGYQFPPISVEIIGHGANACSSMVERMHRILNAAVLLQPDLHNWVDWLPLVLLGMRAAIKADIGFTAAEVLYVSTLHLPGEFISQID